MPATTEHFDYQQKLLGELEELAYQKTDSVKDFKEFQSIIKRIYSSIEETKRFSIVFEKPVIKSIKPSVVCPL